MTSDRQHGAVMAQVLSDLPFPAHRWQLIAEAAVYGADSVTTGKLHRLPARLYADCADVTAAIAGAPQRPRPPRRRLVVPMNVPQRSLVRAVS
jgi:uncharacterized protein DUF2795